jgi:hypothetical protein
MRASVVGYTCSMFDEVWQGKGVIRRKSSWIYVSQFVSHTMQTFAKPKGYGACPSHFRATCQRASRGGSSGYDEAGYQLMAGLGSLAPYDVEREDWGRQLQELENLLLPTEAGGTMVPPDDGAVLAWFDRRVPRCMALIPPRRRGTFLEGVYRYVLAEGHTVGE